VRPLQHSVTPLRNGEGRRSASAARRPEGRGVAVVREREEPPVEIDARIEQVEAAIGRRLIVRTVRTPEPEFRGWVQVRPSAVVIEYVEELPGYFWGFELLERLLDWVEAGGCTAWFYEQGGRLVSIPAESNQQQGSVQTQ